MSSADAGIDLSALPTRARQDVQKYLLPDERAKVVTRRHWAVLIEPTQSRATTTGITNLRGSMCASSGTAISVEPKPVMAKIV